MGLTSEPCDPRKLPKKKKKKVNKSYNKNKFAWEAAQVRKISHNVWCVPPLRLIKVNF
jgi:hypothetical protein